MDPQPLFCPIETCPSRGIVGAGNLKIHDSLRNRWQCRTCGQTFSGKKGTIFYGLKHEGQLVVWVVSLLAFGCPLQAIVRRSKKGLHSLRQRKTVALHETVKSGCL